MKHLQPLFRLFIVALLAAFFGTPASQAQNRHTYTGPYTLGHILKGHAAFGYTLARKDTLRQGPFQFNSVYTDTTAASIRYYSVTYAGAYEKGAKTGPWQFTYKQITPTGQVREQGNQIIHQSTGEESIVKAAFIAGEANGPWALLERGIANSNPSDTLSFARAGFSRGRLSGHMEGLYQGARFSGNFNAAGFMDGRWVFRTPAEGPLAGASEHRIYEAGVLTDHYFLTGPDTLRIYYTGLGSTAAPGAAWENLPLGQRYFETLEMAFTGTSSKSPGPAAKAIEATNDRLEDLFGLLSRKSNLEYWQLAGGSQPVTRAVVRLQKIPFSDKEKANLEVTNRLLSEMNSVYAQIFNNTQIEIARLANHDLMLHYELLKVYHSQTAKITALLAHRNKPSFQYLYREQLLRHLVAGMQFPDSVSYRFRGEEQKSAYRFAVLPAQQAQTLEGINQHLEQMLKDINRVEAHISRMVKKNLLEARLMDKERRMISLKDSVLSLYANTPPQERYNQYHGRVAAKVQHTANELFMHYAGLPIPAKTDTIDALLDCYESLLRLYQLQAGLPARLQRLDEAYTRTVWNPFTMTYMKERMKSRVYDAFEDHILPHFLTELENYNQCSELEQKYSFFDVIYARMLEIRNHDTKDISRQLRGESSLTRILEILNMNLNAN